MADQGSLLFTLALFSSVFSTKNPNKLCESNQNHVSMARCIMSDLDENFLGTILMETVIESVELIRRRRRFYSVSSGEISFYRRMTEEIDLFSMNLVINGNEISGETDGKSGTERASFRPGPQNPSDKEMTFLKQCLDQIDTRPPNMNYLTKGWSFEYIAFSCQFLFVKTYATFKDQDYVYATIHSEKKTMPTGDEKSTLCSVLDEGEDAVNLLEQKNKDISIDLDAINERLGNIHSLADDITKSSDVSNCHFLASEIKSELVGVREFVKDSLLTAESQKCAISNLMCVIESATPDEGETDIQNDSNDPGQSC